MPDGLKTSRVTLFKNDLAFIEREGNFAGNDDGAFHMQVDKSTLDVVMSTLSTSTSQSNGDGIKVEFDSRGPEATIARAPSDKDTYRFAIGESADVGAFLSSIVGSKVEITLSESKSVEGLVLLVETDKQVIPGTEQTQQKYTFVHLMQPGCSVLKVDLADVTGYCIKDQYIQEQLIKSLGNRIRGRKPAPKVDPSKIGVSFSRPQAESTAFASDEEDSLRVSYIDAAKEWKCLYRLEIGVVEATFEKSPVTLEHLVGTHISYLYRLGTLSYCMCGICRHQFTILVTRTGIMSAFLSLPANSSCSKNFIKT